MPRLDIYGNRTIMEPEKRKEGINMANSGKDAKQKEKEPETEEGEAGIPQCFNVDFTGDGS